MKKEYKYFGVVFSIFVFSVVSLAMLLRKYSLLTFQHFLEVCQQIAKTIFSSGVHYAGLLLVVTMLLVAAAFFLKALFSYIKTQNKLSNLLKHKLYKTPHKLRRIIENVNLQEHEVTVIKSNSDLAFSCGLRSQRIVVSTSLVNKLSTSQLEAVMLHEKYHSRSKHQLLSIISEVISSALFFLPFLKELTGRMKVVFENQADLYAIQNQNTDKHLKLALLKVSNNGLDQYTGFTQRREYILSKVKLLTSLFVILLGLVLFLLPAESHANQSIGPDKQVYICGGDQCSTHCPAKNMSQEPAIFSSLQYNLSLISN